MTRRDRRRVEAMARERWTLRLFALGLLLIFATIIEIGVLERAQRERIKVGQSEVSTWR